MKSLTLRYALRCADLVRLEHDGDSTRNALAGCRLKLGGNLRFLAHVPYTLWFAEMPY